jgi:hypothetical protein
VRSGFELRRGRLSLFYMPEEVVVGGLAVSCLLVFYLVVSLIYVKYVGDRKFIYYVDI